MLHMRVKGGIKADDLANFKGSKGSVQCLTDKVKRKCTRN